MRRSLMIDLSTASRLDLAPDQVSRVEEHYAKASQTDRKLARAILIGIVLMIVAGNVMGVLSIKAGQAAGLSRPVAIGVAAVLTPTTLIAAWFTIFPRVIRPAVRRSLRACGHDVCESCGYDRTGLESAAPCPECGRVVRTALGA